MEREPGAGDGVDAQGSYRDLSDGVVTGVGDEDAAVARRAELRRDTGREVEARQATVSVLEAGRRVGHAHEEGHVVDLEQARAQDRVAGVLDDEQLARELEREPGDLGRGGAAELTREQGVEGWTRRRSSSAPRG